MQTRLHEASMEQGREGYRASALQSANAADRRALKSSLPNLVMARPRRMNGQIRVLTSVADPGSDCPLLRNAEVINHGPI